MGSTELGKDLLMMWGLMLFVTSDLLNPLKASRTLFVIDSKRMLALSTTIRFIKVVIELRPADTEILIQRVDIPLQVFASLFNAGQSQDENGFA